MLNLIMFLDLILGTFGWLKRNLFDIPLEDKAQYKRDEIKEKCVEIIQFDKE